MYDKTAVMQTKYNAVRQQGPERDKDRKQSGHHAAHQQAGLVQVQSVDPRAVRQPAEPYLADRLCSCHDANQRCALGPWDAKVLPVLDLRQRSVGLQLSSY